MIFENVRHIVEHGRPVVRADFIIQDGRQGSVAVPQQEYAAHGEAALEIAAEAIERRIAPHRYDPPEADRYAEIRGR